MIKVNSKVIIKRLEHEGLTKISKPPIMIVEGLYCEKTAGVVDLRKESDKKPTLAKCVWYNIANELQEKFINLEILTEN